VGSNGIRRAWLYAAIAATTLLGGCSSLGGFCVWDCSSRSARSTSVVQYLYPDGQVPPPSTPQLRLPLRVGLAFLPGSGEIAGLEEQRRRELLESVRARFVTKSYVADIVLVPETDLQGGGRSLAVDQLARLYSLDLVALVSYDQVAHRDENALAVSYLTIVGAYVLPGSRHEVHTLVDLAVVDPATRQLVLRAAGASRGAGTSTLAGQQRELRADQGAGFERAVAAMSDRLAVELDRFEADVKAGKARVHVAQRDGGAGSFGIAGTGALVVLLLVRAAAARGPVPAPQRPLSFRPRWRNARASRGTSRRASARS
jgi:rhombotail lipoprotein